jgi:hypothetical protein
VKGITHFHQTKYIISTMNGFIHCSCTTKYFATKGSMTSGKRGKNINFTATINAVGSHPPSMLIFPRIHFKACKLKDDPNGREVPAHLDGLINNFYGVLVKFH